MYTEVIQDAVIGLLKEGRITFASGVSLTVSPEKLREVYDDLEFFRSRILCGRRKSPIVRRWSAALG